MELRHPNYWHNASVLDSLSDGDLVEFPRGGYSHWAVYIGNEEVVHLAGEDNDGINGNLKPQHTFTVCGEIFDKAYIRKDHFWTVVCDSKARKNNNKDSKWSPLEPARIVANALRKIGTVGYNLLFSNCEHFAKWCRYGLSKSDQVDNVLTGVATGIAVGLTVGVVYAFAKFFNSDESEKEEKEKNRIKQ